MDFLTSKSKVKQMSIIVDNKKARFDYEVLEAFEAGMVLEGWEVKSIRAKNCNIRAAWVSIDKKDELFLKNFKISLYPFSSEIQETERPRKLLLKKKEISKIKNYLNEAGRTVVPMRIFTKNGRLKLEIAVVRGKKKYEKKQILKERSVDREIRRDIKNY